MNRQWRIHRQWIETQDAQRRWDRAYQYLLQWSDETTLEQPAAVLSNAQSMLEVTDENRRVCTSIDPTSRPDTDY